MGDPITIVLTGDEVASAIGLHVAQRVAWKGGPTSVKVETTIANNEIAEVRVTLSDPMKNGETE
ncbi:hypothetical protein [Caudoviricetes sp.]|nr:hypothetical protein [Caudoviricetes sp.]